MTINLQSYRDRTGRNTKVHSGEERRANSLNSESFISWQIRHLEPPRKTNKNLELIKCKKTTKNRNTSLFNSLNRGRIAIFIDGANLFYSAMELGIEINYTKLLQCLTADSKLLRSFFYTGVDSNNDKQNNFLLWMRRNGYRVIAKELIEFADGSKKGNLDVEIAVDMMTLIGCYDTAVLVSGDGDLAYAVNAVSYRGIRIEVVSLRSMTSDSLINVADAYVDLEEIKDQIKKTPCAAICS